MPISGYRQGRANCDPSDLYVLHVIVQSLAIMVLTWLYNTCVEVTKNSSSAT
jgi:hypothetical protein